MMVSTTSKGDAYVMETPDEYAARILAEYLIAIQIEDLSRVKQLAALLLTLSPKTEVKQ